MKIKFTYEFIDGILKQLMEKNKGATHKNNLVGLTPRSVSKILGGKSKTIDEWFNEPDNQLKVLNNHLSVGIKDPAEHNRKVSNSKTKLKSKRIIGKYTYDYEK